MTIEISDSDTANTKSLRTTKITIAIAIVLTLIHMLIAPALISSGSNLRNTSAFMGALMAPMIMGLIVVALFQIGKRFRNQRSRWKIYSWTLAIWLLSSIVRLVQMVVPASGA